MRLTEKDDMGNWCLKGVRWEQLRAGHMITLDVAKKLYGALCKLKDYEDTGASPDGVEQLIEKYAEAVAMLTFPIYEWIPVEERLPKEDEWVQVIVKRHRWIADFDNEYVPDKEKTDHPERKYCTIGKLKKDNTWLYLDLESDDETPWIDAADDCSQEDLRYPMTEVIAWMPLSVLYREEEKPTANTDWKGHYIDRFERVD